MLFLILMFWIWHIYRAAVSLAYSFNKCDALHICMRSTDLLTQRAATQT